jgi:hypothetical protein
VTLLDKLEALQYNYPKLYIVLETVVPDLIENPKEATKEAIDNYNFWVSTLCDAELYTINR